MRHVTAILLSRAVRKCLPFIFLFSDEGKRLAVSLFLPVFSLARFAALQDLVAAGLACLLPSLDLWKGATVAGPVPGLHGGKIVEVYLQRWPADKKVGRFASSFIYHTSH